MQKFENIQDYISSLPPSRQETISKIRKIINENIPEWFVECISYNMIGRVVPHELYPDGYHCDPSMPLPFINLASQKSHIAVYHMWVYSDPDLMEWFTHEYALRVATKLNMGKSCIRFKNPKHIPYDLIWELVSKITVDQRVGIYKKSRDV